MQIALWWTNWREGAQGGLNMKPAGGFFWLILAGLLLPGAGCSSPSTKYGSAADDITTQLIDQLGERTDLRRARVLVREFKPCAAPVRAGNRQREHTDHTIARRIKHHLMSALARRVVVVDDGWVEEGSRPASGRDTDENSYPDARRLGATVVLDGNYAVIKTTEILLLARLVDAKSHEILATAENMIRSADLPRQQR